jgi:hypothetical protein
MTITVDDLKRLGSLREVAGRHCECRPLDLARDTHSHDCDTDILVDLRRALIEAVPDLCAEVQRLRAEGEAARKHRDAERDEEDARRRGLEAEVSELRACLADAVGKIEVMRAENERLRTRPWETLREQGFKVRVGETKPLTYDDLDAIIAADGRGWLEFDGVRAVFDALKERGLCVGDAPEDQ